LESPVFTVQIAMVLGLVLVTIFLFINDLLKPYNITPFRLFSVTPAGIAIVLTGIIYFIFLGRFVLPRETQREDQLEDTRTDPLNYYPEVSKLFELESSAGNNLDPKTLDLCDAHNIHTVALSLDGGGHKIIPPDRDLHVAPGSVFAVYGSQEHVEQAAQAFGFKIKQGLEVFAEELSRDFSGVVEAIVSPHSSFIGKTLIEVRFRHNHLMAPLSIVHQGEIHYQKLGPRVLASGDVILMHGKWESFQRMRPKRDLLFAQPLHHEVPLTNKAWAAISCFVLSTVLVIFTSLPISICLMSGALGMILTNVLSIDEAYHGVDWRTVFLLSGLIPLGLAMQKTHAASWLAYYILSMIGTPSPSEFFFIVAFMTTLLTLVVSNVGATVLLVPLVVDMSGSINVDPRLAALVVGLAASNAFLLPTHQVNALYMGPGGYKSIDYLKAGTPLSIIYLLILTGIIVFVYQ